jgi:hypothetical protein
MAAARTHGDNMKPKNLGQVLPAPESMNGPAVETFLDLVARLMALKHLQKLRYGSDETNGESANAASIGQTTKNKIDKGDVHDKNGTHEK